MTGVSGISVSSHLSLKSTGEIRADRAGAGRLDCHHNYSNGLDLQCTLGKHSSYHSRHLIQIFISTIYQNPKLFQSKIVQSISRLHPSHSVTVSQLYHPPDLLPLQYHRDG